MVTGLVPMGTGDYANRPIVVERMIVRRYKSAQVPAAILRARLSGVSSRHAQFRELSDEEKSAAIVELREIVNAVPTGAELLAEVAGLLLGVHDPDQTPENLPADVIEALHLEHARGRRQAELLIAAGADITRLPLWIEEGRYRAAVPRPGDQRPHPTPPATRGGLP
jgi:hypothetical protein